MQALVDGAVAEHGRVDVLVNNAGLGGTADIVDMTDEQWHKVLDITLTGTFRMHACCAAADVRAGQRRDRQQRVGPRLAGAGRAGPLRRGQGRRDGPHPLRGDRGRTARRAHRTRSPRRSPCTAFLAKVTTDELLEELTEREAFGRAAEPWEIATVIAFLASDYSTYMTGEVVSVSSQRA